MEQLIAKINGRSYSVSNENLNQLDILQTGPNEYHLIKDDQSYLCSVNAIDWSNKEMVLSLNGKEVSVEISDHVDQLVEKLGLSVAAVAKSNDAFAPMPGLVLEVLVNVGEEIEAGTPLLILEAMKMENVLKSEGAGLVKSISVKKGDAVEKRQLLIEIE